MNDYMSDEAYIPKWFAVPAILAILALGGWVIAQAVRHGPLAWGN